MVGEIDPRQANTNTDEAHADSREARPDTAPIEGTNPVGRSDLDIVREGAMSTWESLSPGSRAGFKIGAVATAAVLLVGGAFKLGERHSSGDDTPQLAIAGQLEEEPKSIEDFVAEDGEILLEVGMIPRELVAVSPQARIRIGGIISDNELHDQGGENDSNQPQLLWKWRGAIVQEVTMIVNGHERSVWLRMDHPLEVFVDGAGYWSAIHEHSGELITSKYSLLTEDKVVAADEHYEMEPLPYIDDPHSGQYVHSEPISLSYGLNELVISDIQNQELRGNYSHARSIARFYLHKEDALEGLGEEPLYIGQHNDEIFKDIDEQEGLQGNTN